MANNGIVRRIDDLGRLVIPKEIRLGLKIKDDDLLEISTTKDGSIMVRKYYRSFEQCAIDWYNFKINKIGYFRKTKFWHHGDYTFCVVPMENNTTRTGFAKRFEKDAFDERIGRVAAYARAMGYNLNKMIGYEG